MALRRAGEHFSKVYAQINRKLTLCGKVTQNEDFFLSVDKYLWISVMCQIIPDAQREREAIRV